jgi:flagellar biosynthesis/type III secretory pathway protein FliH
MIELFQRNFDAEPDNAASGGMARPEAPAQDDLQPKLDAAKQEGFEAGIARGQELAQASFESAAADALAQVRQEILGQLSHLAAQEQAWRQMTERDCVEMFLALAERLFPELLDRFGSDLAVERVRNCLAQAQPTRRLRIKASPDLLEMLEPEIAAWRAEQDDGPEVSLSANAELTGPAVQVTWQDGGLTYDPAAACAGVLEALRSAAQTETTTPQEVEEV